MQQWIERVRQAVTAWPGVSANPHRFGGVEFNLGRIEVGHIHSNGMVDIPFNSKIRDRLIEEQRAEPHHLLPDTGWISFYIRSEGDVERAVWLYRLSYLFHASRGSGRQWVNGAVVIPEALDQLELSVPLRAIVDRLVAPSGR